MSDVLKISLDYGLSVYDASYLSLAKKLSLPLATLDNRLKEITLKEGIYYPGQD
jgi:predicted nucleic acid-binding protein